jgi:hypothetical protein
MTILRSMQPGNTLPPDTDITMAAQKVRKKETCRISSIFREGLVSFHDKNNLPALELSAIIIYKLY